MYQYHGTICLSRPRLTLLKMGSLQRGHTSSLFSAKSAAAMSGATHPMQSGLAHTIFCMERSGASGKQEGAHMHFSFVTALASHTKNRSATFP